MNVLTVIPAKLGSTRLPKKNILPLGGKPLLQWTVETALAAGCCGEVMVSTESEEVAEVARAAGAEVPFMRPEYLGCDPYEVYDVCSHALNAYDELGRTFDTLVLLLPTSPFRSVEDIQGTFAVFEKNNASFAASVSRFECDLFCAHTMDESGRLNAMFPDLFHMASCDRPTPYEINGAVHVADVTAVRKQRTVCGDNFYGHEMDWWRSVDIDTKADFTYAEYLINSGIVKDSIHRMV